MSQYWLAMTSSNKVLHMLCCCVVLMQYVGFGKIAGCTCQNKRETRFRANMYITFNTITSHNQKMCCLSLFITRYRTLNYDNSSDWLCL